jgi:hypothetical protein
MESTNPTLLESAPRTGLEAIDRILDGLEKGHTGLAAEYCYEANGVCCPIGYLLTSEQRQQIAEAGLMSGPLNIIAEKFGRQNIEAMTGMRLEIAQRLQRELDAQPSDEAIKEVLLAFREEYERVLSKSNPGLPGNQDQDDPEELEDDAQDELQALEDERPLDLDFTMSEEDLRPEETEGDEPLLPSAENEQQAQLPRSFE